MHISFNEVSLVHHHRVVVVLIMPTTRVEFINVRDWGFLRAREEEQKNNIALIYMSIDSN